MFTTPIEREGKPKEVLLANIYPRECYFKLEQP